MAQDSIHVGDWIKEFYWDKSENITYGAINPKRLTKSRSVTRKSSRLSGSAKKEINVTFIGRLSRDNEVHKYIELVKVLKSKNKKLNIIWVGEGEFRKECEKLGEVTGFVKNISKYLVNRDLVFSSSYLSILEAQLLKNNVCAFYSNKLKKAYLETFSGSKYMLISDNVEGMIKKINFLFSSPKLKEESGLEAAKFAKKQTWKKVVDLYLRVWNK